MTTYCRKNRLLIMALLILFTLSGCASYKYTSGGKPYGEGYIVLRNNTAIADYTIGKDNKAPLDLDLAKERFKKRRAQVECYYKKMGIIYSPYSSFVTYPAAIIGMVGGIFKLPFILVSDYRYEHNPEYRKKIDALEMERRIEDMKKRQELQDRLNNFIKKEIEKEDALKGKK